MPDASSSVDYQAVFRALPDIMLLMTPESVILDTTDAHVAAGLKPRAEVVGHTLFEAYPLTDESQRAELERSHQHVREHRTPHTMPLMRYDLERPAAQGGGLEETYWQATHFPVLDEQGQLRHLLQRAQNVTGQVQAEREKAAAEQALLAEQERTRFLLENLPVMIWTNDAHGNPDYYNQRWQTYTGLPAEVGAEWAAAQLVHPDDEARVAREVEQAVGNGKEYQLEFRLRRHDGQYRWILARNVPRLDAEGRVLMWVGGGVDVHDQKLLVQELLETTEQQAALSEQSYQNAREAQTQRETLRNLLLQAPAMISIVRGPEHRYEFVNPPYESLFPGRQLLGRTVAEAVPEVVGQGFIQILDDVLRTGQAYHGHEMLIMLDRHGNGQVEETYFNFVYQRFTENDEPAGINCFAHEVTELVRVRQLLQARAAGPDTP